jgi:hypothetical protein
MAVSLRVYPNLSPRIIEVLDPTTDVTVQELVNAIRAWEDTETGELYPALIDAAGKEELGGGVVVGITATLQNARLMFTGRTTPADDGSGRTCDQTDALGETLFVNDADFVTAGVYPGCTVFNATTGELAAVYEVTNLNTLRSFPLSGRGGLGWTSGDDYVVFFNVQCNITGGNLVAVDDVGAELAPAFQSPNVQIVRSSSSSATLQELGSIQYISFGGGITVDETSPYTGTDFPVGTPQQPVNNLSDALLIAASRGFTTFFIVGDAIIDSGGDYSGMIFIGESMTKSHLTIASDANVLNSEFESAYVTGTLDGNARLKGCCIDNLTYVYGVIEQCMLNPGAIVLGGSNAAHFLDCWSGVAGSNTPTINCGGSGQSLALRNYNGGIKLLNKSGSDPISIDLNSGHIVLDNTITNGEIVLRGVGKLTDNSVGASVDDSYLLSPDSIINQFMEEQLSSHIISGSVGEAFNKIAFIAAIEGGRWRIDEATNQMIFYEEDNSTEVARFNLKDSSGSPASTSVFERTRV